MITKKYEIKAPVHEVWLALTDPKYISAWGGGPAQIEPKEGSKFSLWGGDIWGENKKVVPEKTLIQDWYSGNDWERPSNACFELSSKDGKTYLTLTHQGVPPKEKVDIDNGWDEFYLGPLKEYLENK